MAIKVYYVLSYIEIMASGSREYHIAGVYKSVEAAKEKLTEAEDYKLLKWNEGFWYRKLESNVVDFGKWSEQFRITKIVEVT